MERNLALAGSVSSSKRQIDFDTRCSLAGKVRVSDQDAVMDPHFGKDEPDLTEAGDVHKLHGCQPDPAPLECDVEDSLSEIMVGAGFATHTWGFADRRSTNRIPQAVFLKGVRDAIESVNRYFDLQYRESLGSVNLVFAVRSSQPYGPQYDWLLNSAWYSGRSLTQGNRGVVNIGINMGGDADSVRRTMMHEISHHFLMPVNYHTWQSQLAGNRVVDIGGRNATWTPYDVQRFATVGVRLQSGVTPPWQDDHWWVPKPNYAWTNPDDPLDVDGNGRVTSRDALLVINAIHAGVQVDPKVKPKYFWDVDASGSITASDALRVINRLRSPNQQSVLLSEKEK